MGVLKKDFVVTFSGQTAQLFFSTIGQALLARGLGPEGRGVFALAITLARTLGIFFTGGQPVVNNIFAGLYKTQRKSLFFQNILFVVIFGSLGMLAMAAYLFWLPVNRGAFGDLPVMLVILAMLLIPVEMIKGILAEMLRGCERIEASVGLTTAGIFLVTLGTFILINLMGYGVTTAMLVTLFVPFILTFVTGWYLREYATLNPRYFSGYLLKESLKFGAVMVLGRTAMFLIYRVGIYLLSYMRVTEAEIGLFAVAAMMAEQTKMIPTAMGQAFLPRLSNNPDARMKQTPFLYRITTIICIACALALAVVAPPVLLILFGREFVGSIVPFLIMLPGLAVFGGSRILGADLWVRRKENYTTIINWLTLVFGAAAGVLLIRPYGINGAAMANTLSFLLLSVLTVVAYVRASGVPRTDLAIRKSDFVYIFQQGLLIVRHMLARCRGKLEDDDSE